MMSLHTSQPYQVTSNELIRIEKVSKRIRVLFHGETIADSNQALLMLEVGRFPVYYFPECDVRKDFLEESTHKDRSKIKGEAAYWHIKVGHKTSENAVWSYIETLPEREDIKGYMAFYWNKVDAWLEDNVEVFGHPRDPNKRIEVVASSLHAQVIIDGKVVAETRCPYIVYETEMPPAYYFPREDVRIELFEPTKTITHCPYKGEASYWSITVGDKRYDDVMWSYLSTLQEAQKITGFYSFYTHLVDEIVVDGEPVRMVSITDEATSFVKKALEEHGKEGIHIYFAGSD
jgi:uncharacterized protein (DUF427 family)